MLEQRLAEARSRSARQKKLAFGLTVAATLLVSFVLAFLSVREGDQAVSAKAPSTASVQPKDGAREDAKEALGNFAKTTEPAIEAARLNAWDTQAHSEIYALKDRAVAAFGAGDYGTTLSLLSEAKVSADQALDKGKEIFQTSLNAAQQFYGRDEVEKADISIEKALAIRPDSAEALALKEKISALPELLNLLEGAARYRAENRPEAEWAALDRVVQLDADRAEARKRRDTLTVEIKERQFAQSIAQGLSDVNAGKLAGAKDSLARARALYPARSEINLLAEKVKELSDAQAYRHLLGLAKRAVAEEDWSKAEARYVQLVKDFPGDKAAESGVALARKIGQLLTSLDDYLNRSHRLSSENVSRAAKALVERAKPLTPKSQLLSEKTRAVKEMINLYNTQVPVTVRSDQQTRIVVRGVGVVGMVSEKVIRLKPGTYNVEGVREGYKAKLVQLSIAPGQKSVSLVIVCDEPISS